MDFTAVWFLLVVSLLGYITVGLGIGHLVSNAVYKDGGTTEDARMFGGISTAAWPIALVVLIGAGIWHQIIYPIITPKAHREKEKAEAEQRKAEGKPAIGAYVD